MSQGCHGPRSQKLAVTWTEKSLCARTGVVLHSEGKKIHEESYLFPSDGRIFVNCYVLDVHSVYIGLVCNSFILQAFIFVTNSIESCPVKRRSKSTNISSRFQLLASGVKGRQVNLSLISSYIPVDRGSLRDTA